MMIKTNRVFLLSMSAHSDHYFCTLFLHHAQRLCMDLSCTLLIEIWHQSVAELINQQINVIEPIVIMVHVIHYYSYHVIQYNCLVI